MSITNRAEDLNRFKAIEIDTARDGQLGAIRTESAKVLTTDDTPTLLKAIACPADTALFIEASILVFKADGSEAGRSKITCTARRDGTANVAVIGTNTEVEVEGVTGEVAVTITANTTDQTAEVKVTGIAATAFAWGGKIESFSLKAA